MINRLRLAAILMTGAAMAGCSHKGDLVLQEGVGVTAIRTVCPAVGVPDYTGDITTFRVPGDTSAANMDVTAAITNLRSTCDDATGGARVYSNATFDVLARRTDVRGARTVTLPYYSVVLRGGSSVVTKRVGQVTLSFADGQERAQARAQAGAYVDRAPSHVLAASNLMSLFGLHRRLRGALMGHLAAFESTSSLPCRRYSGGAERLGLGEAVTAYFDEHVEADAVHEQLATRTICARLVEQEPSLHRDVLFGASACVRLDALAAAPMIESWQHGRSSLLAPPQEEVA